MHLLDDPNERSEALTVDQLKAHDRRKRNSQGVGRPVKSSGVYYRHQVYVNEETYQYILAHKLSNKEPIGSALHRLLMQKKVEGSMQQETLKIPKQDSDIITDEYIKRVGEIVRAKYEYRQKH